jgi:hypothetical protein
MKKHIYFFLLLTGLVTNGFSQAFKKHNFIINGGIGVGVGFAIRNFGSSYLVNYGTPDNTYSPAVDFTAGMLFPVTVEYAISNKFGIGASFQHASYNNNIINNSTTNCFGAFFAFHLLRKERYELYTRLNVGRGFMNYTDNLSSLYFYGSTAYPSNSGTYNYTLTGGFVKPSFGMRYYFTRNIGFFADAGFGIYSFNTSKVDTDNGTYTLPKTFIVTMFNFELTTGLAVKF